MLIFPSIRPQSFTLLTKIHNSPVDVYIPSTQPNMPFQRRRKWIFHWRGRVRLTIWDKVKYRGTVIDWCTGREWPVNCMTVISARWQSNLPFQGQRKWHIPMTSYEEILSERLNYYIIRWRQEVSEFWRPVWRPDPLVTRCGRESQHPAEWAFRPPVEQYWRTEKNADGHKSGGSICRSSVRSPTPSHTQTFQIKWEVYFLKKSSLVFIHCVNVYSACICRWIWIWPYKTVHDGLRAIIILNILWKNHLFQRNYEYTLVCLTTLWQLDSEH